MSTIHGYMVTGDSAGLIKVYNLKELVQEYQFLSYDGGIKSMKFSGTFIS